MVKNKKITVIVAVLMLTTTLLAGCSLAPEGEVGLGEENGVNAPETSGDEVQGADEKETPAPPDEEEPEDDSKTGNSQPTTSTSGTLKSFNADARTITLTTQGDNELELKITGESKVLMGTSVATLAELTSIIGSEVSVEYDAETKTVTAISIKD